MDLRGMGSSVAVEVVSEVTMKNSQLVVQQIADFIVAEIKEASDLSQMMAAEERCGVESCLTLICCLQDLQQLLCQSCQPRLDAECAAAQCQACC